MGFQKNISCLSEEKYLSALQEGLSHPNSIMRYWSGINCISLSHWPDNLLSALRNNLGHEQEEVSLAACEALYQSGETPLILPVISSHLSSTNEMLVLMALNMIEYFEEQDQQVLLPIVRKLKDSSKNNYVVRAAHHLIKEY